MCLMELLMPIKLNSHTFVMEKFLKRERTTFCKTISFSLMLIIIEHPSIQRCKCVWACPCEQLWIVGTVCMYEVIPYQPWDSAAKWHSGEGKPILFISSLLILVFSIFYSHKFLIRKMYCPLTITMCRLAVKLLMMSVSCSLYSMLEKVFHRFYCLWGVSAFSSHFAFFLVTVIQCLTMWELYK